jgi:quercetin 2,3-dioxygenase
MILVRKSEERGHADHGWLQTRHTFSFGDYHDPPWMGFRSLRVLNDDIVAPGEGFGMHPHRDMEIITYVLNGQLEHRDSMGNGSVIQPGAFQYMSAGTGVRHSEFNHSNTNPVHLLQIWIVPEEKGAPPRYAEKPLANPSDGWHLIASRTGRNGSLAIRQDVDLWLARLNENQTLQLSLAPDRHAWIHVAEGSLNVNGHSVQDGDGMALSQERQLELTGLSPARVLVFDLN